MLKYFFLLFSFTSLFAQNSFKNETLHKNIDGIDSYPVYQANLKNSFIDSIIYAGPFLIFCISFQKPNPDKVYRLESSQSNKSWTCHNYSIYRQPLQILNIKCNNELIAKNLFEEPLDIIFKEHNPTSTGFSKISCELKFWRADFAGGEAILSQSFKEQKTIEEARNSIEFKAIRIRKEQFTKPLNPYLVDAYINNHIWNTKRLFEKMIVKLNETVINNSTYNIEESLINKYTLNPLDYSVGKKSHNQIYLNKVTKVDNQTIFSLSYYSSPKSRISLYNKNSNRYYIQQKGKRIQMKTIKDITLNGVRILEELKNGDILNINAMSAASILTFDIYFDQLPKDFPLFDLIEGKRAKRMIPFDIFSIQY